jgi:subtilisin family serine protease
MSQNSYTTAELDGQTSYISRASNKAANRGILVVNSAGNSGGGSWHYIGMPADADSVLAIGAVNAQRQIVGFSSRGPSADGRLKPNVSAQGEGAAVTSLGNGVTYVNGTSFSSPLTAGAAACLWQKFPGRTNMEIFHAIEYSSHLYFNSNNNYGWGIPDFSDIDFTRTGVESVVGTKGDFDLFPNPANETLAIKPGESFQSGGVDVHVYSSGMEVLTVIGIPKDGTTRFAINDLAAGFYIVELRQSGHSEFATVVVAR